METKIIPIGKAICDEEIYPRNLVNWVTVHRYAKAMQAGSKFPPITVAKLGLRNRLIVVDGFHRLQANKNNKESYVEVEILKGLDKKGIYVEAVRRNITHGQQFSGQERATIILTLEKWNLSQEQISEIVRIPIDDIEPFIAKRIVRITETQEDIALKRPLRHLAGTEMEMEPNQGVFSNRDQIQILDSLISLLKNNWINKESAIVKEKLQKVYELLNPYIQRAVLSS